MKEKKYFVITNNVVILSEDSLVLVVQFLNQLFPEQKFNYQTIYSNLKSGNNYIIERHVRTDSGKDIPVLLTIMEGSNV